jgi:hypothetical protein
MADKDAKEEKRHGGQADKGAEEMECTTVCRQEKTQPPIENILHPVSAGGPSSWEGYTAKDGLTWRLSFIPLIQVGTGSILASVPTTHTTILLLSLPPSEFCNVAIKQLVLSHALSNSPFTVMVSRVV